MRIDDDGTIHLRQSDIETFLHCPEQHRRNNWTETLGSESDAALVGTSLHALVETELSNGFFDTLDEATEYAVNFFYANVHSFETEGIPYNRESFKTDDKAALLLVGLARDWWHSQERIFLMGQNPAERHVEWAFDLPFTTVAGTPVWLTGTSDLVMPVRNVVWDWKTAARSYELWEKQRWAPQPTVYTWAAHKAGLLVPDENGLLVFEYKVFMRSTKDDIAPCETYRVTRSQGSFKWLETIVHGIVGLQLGLGTDVPWPVRDSGWHCSPKWCPHFATCKGSHVDPNENWL